MKLARVAIVAAVLSVGTGVWMGGMPARGGDIAPSNSRQAMGQYIREVNVDGVALVKVIDFLRNVSGANLVVNWKTLEAAGVTRDTPITLTVREVTLSKALQLVLSQASPNAPLAWGIDSNVIQVTTQEDLDKQMITKVYIVDDLVMVTTSNVKAPSINLSNIGSSGGTSFGSGNNGNSGGYGNNGGFGNNGGNNGGYGNNNNGGSNGGFFSNSQNGNGNSNGNSNGNGNGANNQNAETPDKNGAALVDLIKNVIRPNIWTDNGGPATIKYFNGKLVVTAPASVQEAIGGPVGNTGVRYGM